MYQHVTIVGNLGRDPEMRYTPSGEAVTNFNVAVNQTHKDANGNLIKTTAWFRVSTWGKTAENCNQYLHKGNKCLVDGHLLFDTKTGGPKVWQGQSGPGASFELSASRVIFLSSKEEETNGNGGNGGSTTPPTDDDEIPF
jgi:single-strand DNA-binding protein